MKWTNKPFRRFDLKKKKTKAAPEDNLEFGSDGASGTL